MAPHVDLYVVVLVNTAGNLSPAALATELVDVLLPAAPVARRAFEGDATPLVGTYAGPARGQRLTVRVTRTPNGLAMAAGNGQPAPLSWIDGWTFALGGQLITFQRDDDAGAAAVLRLDSGGGHYVLRRQPGG